MRTSTTAILESTQEFAEEKFNCVYAFLDKHLEKSWLGKSLGAIGFPALRAYRATLFNTAAVMVVVAMILTVVSALGLSTDEDILLDFPWSKAEGLIAKHDSRNTTVRAHIYVGLSGVLRVIDYHDIYTGVREEKIFEGYFAFKYKNRCVTKYCKDCRAAAQACISSVVIGLLMAIPTLLSDFARSREHEDSNTEKILGAFGGLYGAIADLVSLYSYADGCAEDMPNTITRANGDVIEVHWTEGLGLKCLVAATFLLLIDGLIHLLVPTPVRCQYPEDEEENEENEETHLLEGQASKEPDDTALVQMPEGKEEEAGAAVEEAGAAVEEAAACAEKDPDAAPDAEDGHVVHDGEGDAEYK